MYKIVFLLLVIINLHAEIFVLKEGNIQAHTEVFGDSSINPATKKIDSTLMMQGDITTLKGNISLRARSLVSDNKERDTHMYETIAADKNKIISLYIMKITKVDAKYEIEGMLLLNGIEHEVKSLATIKQSVDTLELSGAFSFHLSRYDIEPPKMLFLTVRDQIDIRYRLNYKDEK